MQKSKLSVACAIAATSVLLSCGNSSEKVINDEQIRFCESTYWMDNTLLIANFGSSELNPLNQEGKGYILQQRGDNLSVLIAADGNLSAPKGMCEEDDHLFICDVNKLVVYNLKDLQQSPQTIRFPEDDVFLNDVSIEDDILYVSVTNTGRIYKIDVSDMQNLHATQPQLLCEVVGANGILVNKGAMYVASYPPDGVTTADNVIYRIPNLQAPAPEKFVTTPGQYDGIALSDDEHTLYVTSWAPVGLFKIDIATREMMPMELKTPLVGPADMTREGNKLFIPDLVNSQVVVLNL